MGVMEKVEGRGDQTRPDQQAGVTREEEKRMELSGGKVDEDGGRGGSRSEGVGPMICSIRCVWKEKEK